MAAPSVVVLCIQASTEASEFFHGSFSPFVLQGFTPGCYESLTVCVWDGVGG